jgi:hypothetical protein
MGLTSHRLHGARGTVPQSVEKEHSDAALLLIVQLGSDRRALRGGCIDA